VMTQYGHGTLGLEFLNLCRDEATLVKNDKLLLQIVSI
jgi:hypothetical protein